MCLFELESFNVISLLSFETRSLKVARFGYLKAVVYSTLSPCMACANFKKVLEVA